MATPTASSRHAVSHQALETETQTPALILMRINDHYRRQVFTRRLNVKHSEEEEDDEEEVGGETEDKGI